jgi:hypothetical protein
MSRLVELRRARIAEAIERLILVLDQLDGDADMEPDAEGEEEPGEDSLQRPS